MPEDLFDPNGPGAGLNEGKRAGLSGAVLDLTTPSQAKDELEIVDLGEFVDADGNKANILHADELGVNVRPEYDELEEVDLSEYTQNTVDTLRPTADVYNDKDDIGVINAAWKNFMLSKDQIELDMWRGLRTNEELDSEDTGSMQDFMRAIFSTDFIESRIQANELDVEANAKRLARYNSQFDNALVEYTDIFTDPKKFWTQTIPNLAGGMIGLMDLPLAMGVVAGIATGGAGAVPAVQAAVVGLTALAASRPFESIAEAQGAADQSYETLIKNGTPEIEARKKSMEAFADVYNDNMKLAWIDAAQLATAFLPFGSAVGRISKFGAANGLIRGSQRIAHYNKYTSAGAKAAKITGVGALEGFEEGEQYKYQQRALNKADDGDRPETWADLWNQEDEEFISSIKGGFLMGLGMAGGGIGIKKALQAAAKVKQEISEKSVTEINWQQDMHRNTVIARAAMTGAEGMLEAMIMRVGRSGAFYTGPDETDATKRKNGSIKQARAYVEQVRERVKEVDSMAINNPNIKNSNNLMTAFLNRKRIEEFKEERTRNDIGTDLSSPKQALLQLDAMIEVLDNENTKIFEGKDVYAENKNKLILEREEILQKFVIGEANKFADDPNYKVREIPGFVAFTSKDGTTSRKNVETGEVTDTKAPTKDTSIKEDIGFWKELHEETTGAIAESGQKMEAASIENEAKNVSSKAGKEDAENKGRLYIQNTLAKGAEKATPTEGQKNVLKQMYEGKWISKSDYEKNSGENLTDDNDGFNKLAKALERGFNRMGNSKQDTGAMMDSMIEHMEDSSVARTRNNEAYGSVLEPVLTIQESIDKAQEALDKGNISEASEALSEAMIQQETAENSVKGRANAKFKETAGHTLGKLSNEIERLNDDIAKANKKREDEIAGKKEVKEPKEKKKAEATKTDTKKTSVKKEEKPQEATKEDIVSDRDYDIFQKSKKVASNIQKKIAAKVYDEEDLSEREAEIYKEKKDLIDELADAIGEEETQKEKDLQSQAKGIVGRLGKAGSIFGITALVGSLAASGYLDIISLVDADVITFAVTVAAASIKSLKDLIRDAFIGISKGKKIKDVKAELESKVQKRYFKYGDRNAKAFAKEVSNLIEEILKIDKRRSEAFKLGNDEKALTLSRLIDAKFQALNIEQKFFDALDLFGPEEAVIAFSSDKRLDIFTSKIREVLEPVITEADGKVRKVLTINDKNGNPMSYNQIFGEIYGYHQIQKGKKLKEGITHLEYYEGLKEISPELYEHLSLHTEGTLQSMFAYYNSISISPSYIALQDKSGNWRMKLENDFYGYPETRSNIRKALNTSAKNTELWKGFDKAFVQFNNERQQLHRELDNMRNVVKKGDDLNKDTEEVERAKELANTYINHIANFLEKYSGVESHRWIGYMSYYAQRRNDIADPTKALQFEILSRSKKSELAINKWIIDKVEQQIKIIRSGSSLFDTDTVTSEMPNSLDNVWVSNRSMVKFQDLVNAYRTDEKTLKLTGNNIIGLGVVIKKVEEDKKLKVFHFVMPDGSTSSVQTKTLKEYKYDPNTTQIVHYTHQYQFDKLDGLVEKVDEVEGKMAIKLKGDDRAYAGLYVIEQDGEVVGYAYQYLDQKKDEALATKNKTKAKPTATERLSSNHADALRSIFAHGTIDNNNELHPLESILARSQSEAVGEAFVKRLATRHVSPNNAVQNNIHFDSGASKDVEKLRTIEMTDERAAMLGPLNKSKKVKNKWVEWYKNNGDFFFAYAPWLKSMDNRLSEQRSMSSTDSLAQRYLMFKDRSKVKDGYLQWMGQQADDPKKVFLRAKRYETNDAKKELAALRKIYGDQVIPTKKDLEKGGREFEYYKKHLKKSDNLGKVPTDLEVEAFLLNETLNNFYIQEYLQPAFRVDEKGKVVAQYNQTKTLRDLVKRKVSGNGMAPGLGMRPTVKQAIYPDFISDGKISEKEFIKGFNENSKFPQITDGSIFISEKLAAELTLAYGSLFNFEHTFKLVYSGHNGRDRLYNKANWIVVNKEMSDWAIEEGFGEDNPITQMHNKFEESDIDVISFESSAKIFPSEKLNAANKDGNPDFSQEAKTIDMDTSYLMFQQNLQGKTGKGREIGEPSDGKAPVQFFTYLKQFEQESQEITRVRNEITRVQYEMLLNEFLSIDSIEGRKQWILERLGNNESAELLRSRLSVAETSMYDAQNTQLDAMISSIIEKSVSAVPILGGRAIEIPNMTGQRLGEIKQEGDEMTLSEGYLPSSYKNYVKKGETAIIIRVPSSGMHSVSTIKVRGFLPPSLGNSIMTDKGIQTIAGADNDGDARHIILRKNIEGGVPTKEQVDGYNKELKTISEKLSDLRSEIKGAQAAFKKGDKLAQKLTSKEFSIIEARYIDKIYNPSKETSSEVTVENRVDFVNNIKLALNYKGQNKAKQKAIDEYLNYLFDKSDSIGYYLDNSQAYIKKQEELNKTIKKRESLKRKIKAYVDSKTNEIYDQIHNIYKDPKNKEALLDPINVNQVVDENRSEDYVGDIAPQNTDKLGSMMSKEEVLLESNHGEIVIGYNAISNQGYAMEVAAGSRLTGLKTGDSIKIPKLTIKNGKISITKGSKYKVSTFAHKNEEIQFQVNQNKGNNLNHALDAVKEALLFTLGYTEFSSPIVNAMYDSGLPPRQIALIMAHPLMKLIVQSKYDIDSPVTNSTVGKDSFQIALEKVYGKAKFKYTRTIGPSQIASIAGAGKRRSDVWSPMTDADWTNSLEYNEDGSRTSGNTVEARKAAAKFIYLIKSFKAISDQKFAVAQLTRLRDEGISSPEEMVKIKSALKTLGIEFTSVYQEDKKGSERSTSELPNDNTTEPLLNFAKYTRGTESPFQNWWNSPEMETSRYLLSAYDTYYTDSHIITSVAGNQIIGELKRFILGEQGSNSASDVFYGGAGTPKSIGKAARIINDLIYATALGITRSNSELIEAIREHYDNGAYAGIENLIFFDFSILDDPTATDYSRSRPIKMRTAEDRQGLPQAEAEQWKLITEKIDPEALDALFQYHLTNYGYNSNAKLAGNFEVIFPDSVRQKTDIALNKTLAYIEKYGRLLNPENQEESKHKDNAQQLVRNIATETIWRMAELHKQAEGKPTERNAKFSVYEKKRYDKEGEYITKNVIPSNVPVVVYKEHGILMKVRAEEGSAPVSYMLKEAEEISGSKDYKNTSQITELQHEQIQNDPTVDKPTNGVGLLKLQQEAKEEQAASVNPDLDRYIKEVLAKNFPDVKVYQDPEAMKRFMSVINKFLPRPEAFNPDVYGAAIFNTIYINENKAVQSTALHEYAHIYWATLPDSNFAKKKLIALFGSEEAAVEAIGKAGVEILKQRKEGKSPSRFMILLKKFWYSVKALYGGLTEKNATEMILFGMTDGKVKSPSFFTTNEIQHHAKKEYSTYAQTVIDYLKGSMPTNKMINVTTLLDNVNYGYPNRAADNEDTTYLEQGNVIHKIAEDVIFNNMADITDDMVRSNIEELKRIKGVENVIGSLTEDVYKDLYQQISKTLRSLNKDDKYKFISEMSIVDPVANVQGKADIIMINKETGFVSIIDIKSTIASQEKFRKEKTFGRGNRNLRSRIQKAAAQLHIYKKVIESQNDKHQGVAVERLIVLPINMGLKGKVLSAPEVYKPIDVGLGTMESDLIQARNDAHSIYDARMTKGRIDEKGGEASILTPDQYYHRILVLDEKKAAEDKVDRLKERIKQLTSEIAKTNDPAEKALKKKQKKAAEQERNIAETKLEKYENMYNEYYNEFDEIRKSFLSDKAREKLLKDLDDPGIVGVTAEQKLREEINKLHRYQTIAIIPAVESLHYALAERIAMRQSGIYDREKIAPHRDMSKLDSLFKNVGNITQEHPVLQEAARKYLAARKAYDLSKENYDKKITILTRKIIDKYSQYGKEATAIKKLTTTKGALLELIRQEYDPTIHPDLSPYFKDFFKEVRVGTEKVKVLKKKEEFPVGSVEYEFLDLQWETMKKFTKPIIDKDGNVTHAVAQIAEKQHEGDFPKVKMNFLEALGQSLNTRYVAAANSLIKSQFSRQVSFHFPKPGIPGQWEYGTYDKLVTLYESHLVDTGVTDQSVSKALEVAKKYSKKAEDYAMQGISEIKDDNYVGGRAKTEGQIFRDRYTGMAIENGTMVNSKTTGKYSMTVSGGIKTQFDNHVSPKSEHSADLYSAFSHNIHDLMYKFHMEDVMAEQIAAQVFYSKLTDTTNGVGKDLNTAVKWMKDHMEHNILQQHNIDQWVKKPSSQRGINWLKYLLFLKVMAFNIPLSLVNGIQGALAVMILQGFRSKTKIKQLDGSFKEIEPNKGQNFGYMTALKRITSDWKKFSNFMELHDINNFKVENHEVKGINNPIFKRAQNWSLWMMKIGEEINQGASFVAYLTPEQWENIDTNGQVKGTREDGSIVPDSPAARKRDMENTYDQTDYAQATGLKIWEDFESPMGKKYNKEFISFDAIAKYKKWKEDILGYYDPRNRGMYARDTVLQMVMMFKTWLPAVLKQHIGVYQEDIYGKEMKGIWITLAHDFAGGVNKLFSMYGDKKVFDNLPETKQVDIENRWRLMKELFVVMGIFILAKGLEDDDDPETQALLRFVNYTHQQVGFMYDFDSFKGMLQHGVPPVSYALQLVEAMKDLVLLEEYKRKGPGYEKGDLKGPRKLLKLTPIVGNISSLGGIKNVVDNPYLNN